MKYADPAVNEVVRLLKRAGLDVEYRGQGDQLHLIGPKNRLSTPELRDLLTDPTFKARVLEALKSRYYGVPVSLMTEPDPSEFVGQCSHCSKWVTMTCVKDGGCFDRRNCPYCKKEKDSSKEGDE